MISNNVLDAGMDSPTLIVSSRPRTGFAPTDDSVFRFADENSGRLVLTNHRSGLSWEP